MIKMSRQCERCVLLVEDDESQAKPLVAALQSADWRVLWATRIDDAKMQVPQADLMLVDRGLPDGDGLDLVSWAQHHFAEVPVILLTAQNTLEERVRGLEDGAADYVGKGVDLREILMRCEMQWRNIERARDMPISVIVVGRDGDPPERRLMISPGERMAAREHRFGQLNSKQARLSQTLEPTSLAVLLYLAKHQGRTISVQSLERQFFHRTEYTRQGLRNVISKVRKRIDGEAAETFLHTYLPRQVGESAGYILLPEPADPAKVKQILPAPAAES